MNKIDFIKQISEWKNSAGILFLSTSIRRLSLDEGNYV